MFEVHTSERPVRVKSYGVAVEIANQFQRDYGIFVAITEDNRPLKDTEIGWRSV